MVLKPGTKLHNGSYKIIRHLSSGGFGCTYEAEHTMLGVRVAIKEFFVKDFCDRDDETGTVSVGTRTKVELVDKLKTKFLDEARAIFNMHHSGIVRVTDIFEDNNTAYYVMEYIDGSSLHEVIKARGLTPEAEAVIIIKEIADALKYVHSLNRLHLDIKPGNIMINKAGHAILIDFGASKQYDEVSGENTSTLLGRTPGYAPIEQMSNRIQTFSAATDIYSLGATLYKLVTGVTPPDASELASDEMTLPPITEKVSENTRNAIYKAMSLRRKDRPQSVDEFVSTLNIIDSAPSAPSDSSEQESKESGANNDAEETIVETTRHETVNKAERDPIIISSELCKVCHNCKFSAQKGLICGLTDEKPDFGASCSDYDENAAAMDFEKNKEMLGDHSSDDHFIMFGMGGVLSSQLSAAIQEDKSPTILKIIFYVIIPLLGVTSLIADAYILRGSMFLAYALYMLFFSYFCVYCFYHKKIETPYLTLLLSAYLFFYSLFNGIIYPSFLHICNLICSVSVIVMLAYSRDYFPKESRNIKLWEHVVFTVPIIGLMLYEILALIINF